jgi:hypothetical protein
VQHPAQVGDSGAPYGPRLSLLPVRQWVLLVPKRLRYFLQRDGATLNMVLRIFLWVIAQTLQTHSPGAASVDKVTLRIGTVAFIHRFGSSLNGHVHFHVCVVNGVFEEVDLFHWTTLEQPQVADSFQPNAGARFDAVLASKLPVDPRLPPIALEQADHKRLLPVTVLNGGECQASCRLGV